MAARTGAVVPVGLRRWAVGRGAEDVAVVRLAGVEQVPRGVADSRQDPADGHRLHRYHASSIWRCTDLWSERQRENADAGSRRANCRAPPNDGGGRTPLWSDVGQLCAGGSPIEGRVGGDRAHRLGGPGAEANLLSKYAKFAEFRLAWPATISVNG